jgi:predicted HAD superfamily Cof-like phosphohydrolase
MYEQSNVEDFHKEFNLTINYTPQLLEKEDIEISMKLIKDEVKELEDAFAAKNIVEIADGIGDIIYVVLGAAVRSGMDMEPLFREIHRSNMTKQGGYKDSHGKWIKPDTYDPPRLLPILIRQGYKP